MEKACSERGKTHVTSVSHMPGCQESRQPGTIIWLGRYLKNMIREINSVPHYTQTKESSAQYEKYNTYWAPVRFTEGKWLTF